MYVENDQAIFFFFLPHRYPIVAVEFLSTLWVNETVLIGLGMGRSSLSVLNEIKLNAYMCSLIYYTGPSSAICLLKDLFRLNSTTFFILLQLQYNLMYNATRLVRIIEFAGL